MTSHLVEYNWLPRLRYETFGGAPPGAILPARCIFRAKDTAYVFFKGQLYPGQSDLEWIEVVW